MGTEIITEMGNVQDEAKPAKIIEEALKQVVQVLYAPYKDDDSKLFFKIFTGRTATDDTKNGQNSGKVGDTDYTGSGTWNVKSGEGTETDVNENNSISYTYEQYQPKGVDTLTITGAYNATLAFIYTKDDLRSDVTESDYDEKLFDTPVNTSQYGDADAMFSDMGGFQD